ncbi:MAG TPA: C2H2-type zinc finger protein [Chthonomonadaceae bacterium]|nr:C2H2-type zinc finger protein [Chthonomonadaceae bacterium]
MKCDVCGEEFANSDDMNRHKERAHPMGQSDGNMEGGEAPDMMENNPSMPEMEEADRRNR